jgi:hypothetical protein
MAQNDLCVNAYMRLRSAPHVPELPRWAVLTRPGRQYNGPVPRFGMQARQLLRSYVPQYEIVAQAKRRHL